ncbi:hypothetical protein UlMin_021392 [Ulmus minor]
MHLVVKQFHGLHRTCFSRYSYLIDRCWWIRSFNFFKIVHAQLVKVGFNHHTFLGNRSIELYCHYGILDDALKVFDDIARKNCVSWNICLKGLFQFGHLDSARLVFDEMPVKDVVSWNSMISGYLSYGDTGNALGFFSKMQNAGVRPSQYTFSILMSSVSCACHGKQVHGSIIRSGMNSSNVVIGNSIISMYGRLGLLDYAFAVFLTMEEVDVISWNSLIWGCYRSGYGELALDQFCFMRTTRHSPDQFTISTVISVCCDMRDLRKGVQILNFSIKLGFFSNSIISSAAIDLFSKCNRLEAAERLFKELDQRDSALYDSMISSYARHGFGEAAMQLFALMMRENLRPTEFTFSSVLSSLSDFLPADQGVHLHSLVVKVGMESEAIVASSLVQMYSKVGLIKDAMKIFANLVEKDLVSWNTIIMGLTFNGCVLKALDIFEELISKGPQPDRITLAGVLLACNYGNFVDEGMKIFSSMEKDYGIIPGEEHYSCIVDLLSRAGKLKEAMDVIEAMPCEPSFTIWGSVLRGSLVHGELELGEKVAEKMTELEPNSSLPYSVLARAYEMRGRWENVIRVRKAMKDKSPNSPIGCSWIGIRNHVYIFKADQLVHHGGRDIYLALRLLFWQMKVENYI